MKKSIKISLFVLITLTTSIFVFAKGKIEAEGTVFCIPGNASLCEFEPFEERLECIIPPTPLTQADCGGTYEKEL